MVLQWAIRAAAHDVVACYHGQGGLSDGCLLIVMLYKNQRYQVAAVYYNTIRTNSDARKSRSSSRLRLFEC